MQPTSPINAMLEVDAALRQQIIFQTNDGAKLQLLKQQQSLLKNILSIQKSEKAVN